MLNIDYDNIAIELRNLVREYDNLAYQLLIYLHNTRELFKLTTINQFDKTIRITAEDIAISFSKNIYYSFIVMFYADGFNFDDNQPLLIRHLIDDDVQRLEIMESLSKGGYYGVVNLPDLSDSFGKKDDEELKLIKSKIEKANKFMYNYSNSKCFTNSKSDDDDIKKLINYRI